MQPEYKSSSGIHVIRIFLTLLGVGILGALLRPIFLPAEFGEYGYYRPSAVTDEAYRAVRNGTNESCYSCHAMIRDVHLAGVHKDISCEGCHGAYADHVRNDIAYARMPVARGDGIQPQCMRCHGQTVRAAPPEMIKMVAYPDHLEAKKVRPVHVCDQCHHVHAPMKWVREAREMMGLAAVEEEVREPWRN